MCKTNSFGLSDREEKFCRLYAKYLNGARAAREAGYKDSVARSMASTMLTKPNILACVKWYRDHLAETMEESAEKIVSEILAIARGGNTQDRDKIKAFELAANLLGHNPTQKVEAKVENHVSGGLKLNIEVKNQEEAEDLDKLGEE